MIRKASPSDDAAIWSIIAPIVRAGETYAIDRDISQADAIAYWLAEDHHCFVSEDEGRLLGTYYLKRNQGGGGGHVCNCGFMVSHNARGRGLARSMCEHAQETARSLGFTAMQFNFVVSTNHAAIGLWKKLGFETVGTLPKAFDHPSEGLVDALIMHREL